MRLQSSRDRSAVAVRSLVDLSDHAWKGALVALLVLLASVVGHALIEGWHPRGWSNRSQTHFQFSGVPPAAVVIDGIKRAQEPDGSVNLPATRFRRIKCISSGGRLLRMHCGALAPATVLEVDCRKRGDVEIVCEEAL